MTFLVFKAENGPLCAKQQRPKSWEGCTAFCGKGVTNARSASRGKRECHRPETRTNPDRSKKGRSPFCVRSL